MNSISCIIYENQTGKEIGIGKFGSIESQEDKTEITVNDVTMAEKDFNIAGPFKLEMEEKFYKNCAPSNFKNLRPGFSYDRVIFLTTK